MTNKELSEKLKLNIQLFADSAANENDIDADNIEDDSEQVETTFTDTSSIDQNDQNEDISDNPEKEEPEVSEKKKTTKKYSERLNKDRELLRQQVEKEQMDKLNAIARKRGFDNWKELENFDRDERIKNIGIEDPKALSDYVNELIVEHPVVKQAQNILQARQQEERNNYLSSELEHIQKYDDSIESIEDIVELPNYDEILAKVQRGYSISDAYISVNLDTINSKKAHKEVLNTKRNIDSKAHLKSQTKGKAVNVFVPEDVMATYKRNMPNWTDQQIKDHYQKTVGGEN